MKSEAIFQNAYSILYFENPTEEDQLEAVRNCSFSIKCIKNPTEKVQLEAIKISPSAIQFADRSFFGKLMRTKKSKL
ncbi:hypothetical protein OIH33_10305, partial [Lactococcus petauri]|nr:hypothetical protein [Lactococcus petauri]